MSTEKQARELLRKVWVLLDLVEPNESITDEIFKFLAASKDIDLERLVEWLKEHHAGFPRVGGEGWTARIHEVEGILEYIAEEFDVGERK